MAAIPKAVLPVLALGSLGATAVSGAASLFAQNPIARSMYPEIPRQATPYNNWFSRMAGKPETNHTFLGFIVWAITFGAVAAPGRFMIHPLTKVLRQKFTYVPGTNTPKRIKTFKDLLFDLCPDVVVNTLPLVPAFPIAMYAKVYADGPGRFRDFNIQYNPYDSLVKYREALYGRPELPVYCLGKLEKKDLRVARPLWGRPLSPNEKLEYHKAIYQ